MKLTIRYYYYETRTGFLSLFKKPEAKEALIDVDIEDLPIRKFPVAMKVPTYIEGLPSYKRYRYYRGYLYVRATRNMLDWEKRISGDDLAELCSRLSFCGDKKEIEKRVRKECKEYVFFGTEVWQKTEEPFYLCYAFEMDHEYQHTNLGVFDREYSFDKAECCFTAFERDKAVAYAMSVAKRQGDSENDIENIKRYSHTIEVRMPQAVKRRPYTGERKGLAV